MTKIRDEKYIRDFGVNVRKKRLAKGLTQSKFADIANISRTQVVYIESGKINPTISTLKVICEALELNPEEILPRMNLNPTPEKKKAD